MMSNAKAGSKLEMLISWLLVPTYLYGMVVLVEKQNWWLVVLTAFFLIGTLADLGNIHFRKGTSSPWWGKMEVAGYVAGVILWGGFFGFSGEYFMGVAGVLCLVGAVSGFGKLKATAKSGVQ